MGGVFLKLRVPLFVIFIHKNWVCAIPKLTKMKMVLHSSSSARTPWEWQDPRPRPHHFSPLPSQESSTVDKWPQQTVECQHRCRLIWQQRRRGVRMGYDSWKKKKKITCGHMSRLIMVLVGHQVENSGLVNTLWYWLTSNSPISHRRQLFPINHNIKRLIWVSEGERTGRIEYQGCQHSFWTCCIFLKKACLGKSERSDISAAARCVANRKPPLA